MVQVIVSAKENNVPTRLRGRYMMMRIWMSEDVSSIRHEHCSMFRISYRFLEPISIGIYFIEKRHKMEQKNNLIWHNSSYFEKSINQIIYQIIFR